MSEPTREQAIARVIFDRIKHGDEAHQTWLRERCESLAAAVLQECEGARAGEPTREQLLRECVNAIAMECWPDLDLKRPLTLIELRELPRYVAAQIERLELTLAAITEIREKLEMLA